MRTLRKLAIFGFLGLSAFAFGCAHKIPLKPTAELMPAVSKVPTTVGIYYAPEFRIYKHEGSRGGDKWIFGLGEASVKLFDQAFPQLFKSVLNVTQRPPLDMAGPEMTGVIEPKIESFNFSLPMVKLGAYTADIAYRFTLYSMQGDPVVSWLVQGSGSQHGQLGFEFTRWPGEAADLAMQDGATKFLTGFRYVPEVRRWMQRAGIPVAKATPNKFETAFIRR